jgi:predicted GIY-YIG superfamily endonuclease
MHAAAASLQQQHSRPAWHMYAITAAHCCCHCCSSTVLQQRLLQHKHKTDTNISSYDPMHLALHTLSAAKAAAAAAGGGGGSAAAAVAGAHAPSLCAHRNLSKA